MRRAAARPQEPEVRVDNRALRGWNRLQGALDRAVRAPQDPARASRDLIPKGTYSPPVHPIRACRHSICRKAIQALLNGRLAARMGVGWGYAVLNADQFL